MTSDDETMVAAIQSDLLNLATQVKDAESEQTGPEDHLHQCGLKTTVLDRCKSLLDQYFAHCASGPTFSSRSHGCSRH